MSEATGTLYERVVYCVMFDTRKHDLDGYWSRDEWDRAACDEGAIDALPNHRLLALISDALNEMMAASGNSSPAAATE